MMASQRNAMTFTICPSAVSLFALGEVHMHTWERSQTLYSLKIDVSAI